jgi:hypothetical protein
MALNYSNFVGEITDFITAKPVVLHGNKANFFSHRKIQYIVPADFGLASHK